MAKIRSSVQFTSSLILTPAVQLSNKMTGLVRPQTYTGTIYGYTERITLLYVHSAFTEFCWNSFIDCEPEDGLA